MWRRSRTVSKSPRIGNHIAAALAVFSCLLICSTLAAQAADSASIIENRGQWPERVLACVPGSGAAVFFTAEGIILDLHDRSKDTGRDPRLDMPARPTGWDVDDQPELGEACAILIRFADADPQTSTELRQAGQAYYNYLQGADPAGWVTRVPCYAEMSYRNLWPGIDLRFWIEAGELHYAFEAGPGADLDLARFDYEGIDTVERDSAGSIRLNTAVGWVSNSRPGANGEDGRLSWHHDGAGAPPPAGPRDEPARLIWSTYLGGDANEAVYCLDSNDDGSLIAGGYTTSPNFPSTLGAYQEDPASEHDGYLAKVDAFDSDLIWCTYIGGNGTDYIQTLALEANGNIACAGETRSDDFPVTAGAYDESYDGTWNAFDTFALKLNADGDALLWASFLGGDYDEFVGGIALTTAGEVCVIGTTDATNFPTTAGAYDETPNGDFDIFLSKLNSTGSTLVWSTLLGGDEFDWSNDITIDNQSNVLVCGETCSSNFPTTAGAYDETFNSAGSEADGFITKLSSDGTSLMWGTFLGATGFDEICAIGIDPIGNLIVAGSTVSEDFPTTPGAYDETHNGGTGYSVYEGFLAKLTETGDQLRWCTYLGGVEDDEITALCLDSGGNPLVIGFTESTSYPTTPDAYDESANGGWDVTVTKLSTFGDALMWSSYLGGSDSDRGHAISCTGSGLVFVGGLTVSTDFPTTTGAFQEAAAGGTDCFIARLDIPGPRTWRLDPGGGGDASSIQAALLLSNPGDVIELSAGTYYEHDLALAYGVTLRSESGQAEDVTIDAQGLGRGLYCLDLDASSVITGLTITGGDAESGGGIYCDNAHPTISHCIFIDNTASDSGGGFRCDNGSAPLLSYCRFEDNTATHGAGVSCSHADPSFEYCLFVDNSSDQGGGMKCHYAGPTLDHCTFHGNSASTGGGINNWDGTPTLTNVIIAGSASGGAMSCGGASSPTLLCCDIHGNTGGDWTTCIAGQLGIDGNISEDPLFCDAAGGDLTLRDDSSCAEANNPGCGQVGALGIGCSSGGQVWHVPGDIATIQGGINLAAAGDTVLVAAGTYYEFDINHKSGVILISESGPSLTIIDANSQGHGFLCINVDSAASIEGFTITGGEWLYDGGGMFCQESDLLIKNCIFMGNHCYDGAGIYLYYSSPTVEGCVFFDNNADDDGGALHCQYSSPVIVDCTFYDNGAPTGGGIYAWNASTPTLDNTIISFSSYGAAVYSDGGSSVTLTCSDIFGNVGGDWTGGIVDQLGQDGNISADPQFCDTDAGDFTLAEGSPCSEAVSACGQIGSFGVGCGGTTSYLVFPDGGGVYPTIQSAIDAASAGDTVLLADGTFTGEGNRDLQYWGKAITVMSQSGDPEVCILDCQGSEAEPHLGFKFHQGEIGSSVLQGITVTGGYSPNGGWGGGGIQCLDPSAPTIINCRIVSNHLSGIMIMGQNTLSPTLIGCEITGNLGNGIHCDVAGGTFIDCLIADNAENGLECVDEIGAFTMTGCTVKDNGMHGISLYEGTSTIEDCLIVNNAWDGIWYSDTYSERIIGCTISGNRNGINLANDPYGSTLEMDNLIIAFNNEEGVRYVSHPTSSAEVSCCDIFGNSGGDWTDEIVDLLGVNGNISLDPLFCDALGIDFTLQSGSPCSDEVSGCGQMGAFGVGCAAVVTSYLVYPDGSGDYPTIQAAIDAASVGDTVLLAPGLFTGSGNYDLQMKSAITLKGQTGSPADAIIDAQSLGRCLAGTYLASSTLIQGITFTGGVSPGYEYEDRGAGIFIGYGAAQIRDCVITGNTGEGGGLFSYESDVELFDCEVHTNTGDGLSLCAISSIRFDLESCAILDNTGMGIVVLQLTDTCSPMLAATDCQINGNGLGGVVAYAQSSVILFDCDIMNNGGTGVAANYSGDVQNCRIDGNSGSGIDFSDTAWYPGEFSVTNCSFNGNTGSGMAVHLEGNETVSSIMDIMSCTFNGEGTATGIDLTISPESICSINSCTLYDCSPGIACTGTGLTTVDNTVIAFSSQGGGVEGVLDLTCCDIYGNVGGDWTGGIADQLGQDGNISEDPLFCDATGGDFTLREDSPCAAANNPDCGQIGAYGVGCSEPVVWHVPGDAATIEGGINLAAAGDTVIVACGTYYERNIFLKSGVVLISTTGEASCVTIDAQGLGKIFYGLNLDAATRVQGFTITGGLSSGGQGGGMQCGDASLTVTNCDFVGNEAGWAGAIRFSNGTPTLRNCRFIGNIAGRGGAIQSSGATVFAYDCLFADNEGTSSGGAVRLDDAHPEFHGCTFHGNSSPDGSCICAYSSSLPMFYNTIITGGVNSAPVTCDGTSSATASCTDIHGNAGGDWVGCLAGQDGGNGNISDDPLFCDAAGGDFTLHEDSPCAAANNPGCGQIGAYGVGCSVPPPFVQYIGLFTDLSAEICYQDLPIYVLTEVQVIAVLDPDEEPITGVEFRIDNLPVTGPFGIRTDIWNDGIHIGMPEDGITIVFPVPVSGPLVHIGTMQFLSFSAQWAGVDHLMEVVEHPSSGMISIFDIDYQQIEVLGGRHTFNCNDPGGCECFILAPTTIHVTIDGDDSSGDGSAGNPYASIQYGVIAAAPLDTVMVGPGTYTGEGNRDIDFAGTDLVLIGSSGRDETIIDCEGSVGDPHRGFVFHSGETSATLITGFTIRNGEAYEAPPLLDHGGGILCVGTAVRIQDCVIENCNAPFGGGVSLTEGSEEMRGCVVTGCLGGLQGGGIFARAGAALIDCVVSGNISDNPSAGGIDIGDSVLVADCQVSANQGGSGLKAQGGTVLRCDIFDNIPDSGSCCGIKVLPGTVVTVIDSCRIHNNEGEGIYCEDEAFITYCTIYDNGGPGIGCYYSSPTISGCTIQRNGGGIDCYDSAAIISHSIIGLSESGPGISCGGEAQPTVICCDIYENAGGNEVCGIDGGGNFTANPLFCDAYSDDFTLAANSPCLPENNDCGELVGAWGQGCTAVDAPAPELPVRIALRQNVPNPFNPTTEIRFDLPTPAAVTLSIYSVDGRLIHRLLDKVQMPAGYQSASWTGRDDTGHRVSSGVYFYRLETEGFQASRKMLLIK